MADFNVLLLKSLMAIGKIKPAELARKIGVTRSCISKILSGQRKNPEYKVLFGFTQVFPGTSVEDFYLPKVSPKSYKNESVLPSTGTEG